MSVNVAALVYIFVMVVFFCFPFVMPAQAANMNYTSAIVGGVLVLVTAWWFVHGRGNYEGPVSGAFSSSFSYFPTPPLHIFIYIYFFYTEGEG